MVILVKIWSRVLKGEPPSASENEITSCDGFLQNIAEILPWVNNWIKKLRYIFYSINVHEPFSGVVIVAPGPTDAGTFVRYRTAGLFNVQK